MKKLMILFSVMVLFGCQPVERAELLEADVPGQMEEIQNELEEIKKQLDQLTYSVMRCE